MADNSNTLTQAFIALGGTGVFVTVAIAIRGYFSGAAAQDKGIQDRLAAENDRLDKANKDLITENAKLRADFNAAQDAARKQLEQAWDDNDVLRKDIRIVERQSAHRLDGREAARIRVNLLEQQLNLPQTQWPPDPVDTLAHD